MPLDATSRQRLISGWWAAFDEVDALCHEAPDDAWGLILAILASDSSDKSQGMLAAGPLEDLLTRHSQMVIARVEMEARRNPLFAKLLGGVWQNDMSDDVWARVQAVWDRRGWDGIPEA